MDIAQVKQRTYGMADTVYKMLGLIEKGFMENKLEPLTEALGLENSLNVLEKELTGQIVGGSPRTGDVKELVALEQMIETFERMGDEASNLIERIEIKVQEKLLFSDAGVKQYNETYAAMKCSIEMMRDYLRKPSDPLKKRVIDNGFKVRDLVEKSRQDHTERLLKGLCTPLGANMYFDMLDFTGNLARHASYVVKLFS